jgi:hypothetical protein
VRALSRLNRPVVAIAAVTLLAGWLRIVHVSHPSDYVFDEVYYPKAACILVGWSNDTCTVNSSDEQYWRQQKWDVGSWVHPPLGKWEIAMGIKAYGMRAFGWRISSVVAGTFVVTLTAVLAQLLFGSALWTAVAGLLMAVENLNVVMSRVGLLDIHVEFWIVLAFVLFLLDRRWLERRQAVTDDMAAIEEPDGPDPPPDPPPGLAPDLATDPAATGAGDAAATARGLADLAAVAFRRRGRARRRDGGEVVGRLRAVRGRGARIYVGDHPAAPRRPHVAAVVRPGGLA